MSDPTPSSPVPVLVQDVLDRVLTPGMKTSEGKVLTVLSVSSTGIALLAGALDGLAAAFPDSHLIHGAVAVVALIVALLAALGFGQSRVSVKTAALALLSDIHGQQADAASAVVESQKILTILPDGTKVVGVALPIPAAPKA